jgi:hypothetical protein
MQISRILLCNVEIENRHGRDSIKKKNKSRTFLLKKFFDPVGVWGNKHFFNCGPIYTKLWEVVRNSKSMDGIRKICRGDQFFERVT